MKHLQRLDVHEYILDFSSNHLDDGCNTSSLSLAMEIRTEQSEPLSMEWKNNLANKKKYIRIMIILCDSSFERSVLQYSELDCEKCEQGATPK